jgi:hypothetical protein
MVAMLKKLGKATVRQAAWRILMESAEQPFKLSLLTS